MRGTSFLKFLFTLVKIRFVAWDKLRAARVYDARGSRAPVRPPTVPVIYSDNRDVSGALSPGGVRPTRDFIVYSVDSLESGNIGFFLRRMRFRYCFRAQTALRRRRRRLRTENQYSSDVINRRTFSRRRLVYSKEESTGALRGSRQTNGSLLKCKRRTHKLFIRKCRVCQVSVRNTEAKSLFSAVFLRRRFSQNGRVRRTGRCSQMEFNNRTIV